jgi:Ca-dependent carbohydrate-binding module xylan-binding
LRSLRKTIIAAVCALFAGTVVPAIAAAGVKIAKYEAASFDVSGEHVVRTEIDPWHNSNGSFLLMNGGEGAPQTASITVDTPADADTIYVRVRGQECADPTQPGTSPWPHFSVRVDGTQVISAYATRTSWSTVGAGADIRAGQHTFSVTFDNEFRIPWVCDRNLRVDHFIIGAGSPAPRLTWAPVGASPLSDEEATTLVTHRPETRPENSAANDYVPTDAELDAFHSAPGIFNPLTRYVTGQPGLPDPSTDDLIQWAAQKWGIPEDWLRAEYVQESNWYQNLGPNRGWGDSRSMSESECLQHPSFARIDSNGDGHCDGAYESLGITQVKWRPSDSPHPGTEPLRWKSTAFNIDYQAATVRYYYDGLCNWCGAGYSAGQAWNSIGAWFSPKPWLNSGQLGYIGRVQSNLANRVWESDFF